VRVDDSAGGVVVGEGLLWGHGVGGGGMGGVGVK
jgi:hypothetical protein